MDDSHETKMSFGRIARHAVVWIGVFVFWLVTTRQYHPTLTIALTVTAVLVSASALAVYVNRSVLLPRFAPRRLSWRYVAALLGMITALDLVAVLLTQVIYDWLWRPDPLRFGFWFNVLSDGIIIAMHVVAAMLCARLVGEYLRMRRNNTRL